MQIEQVHGNLELLSKTDDNALDEIESDIRVFKKPPLLCSIDKTIENNNLIGSMHDSEIKDHTIEFKEAANGLDDNVANDEHNLLFDVEIHETLAVDHALTSKQESKLRKVKLKRHFPKTSPPRTRRKTSLATKHLRDSTNNTKGNKQMKNQKVAEKQINSNRLENQSDEENFSTKQEPSASAELEKDLVDSHSKNKINPEHSSIKLNHQTKAIRNEKDKFLAENFKMTCFLCETPFETFSNVHKHFKEFHNEPGYIQCCDKKFFRRNVLIDHVNYHLNPNFFKCNQCDKVMEDRRRLELHSKTHEINNGKNFCCNICGKGFIKLTMLNKHKKIHLSDEEKRFQCHECGKK